MLETTVHFDLNSLSFLMNFGVGRRAVPNGSEVVHGRVSLVVRALAFYQCGPGSITALGVICRLSLLVLYSAQRGFSPGTPVFPSHQKPTFKQLGLRLLGF